MSIADIVTGRRYWDQATALPEWAALAQQKQQASLGQYYCGHWGSSISKHGWVPTGSELMYGSGQQGFTNKPPMLKFYWFA